MPNELIPLFPTTVYHSIDTSVISVVESWFEDVTRLNWLNDLRNAAINENFKTTLVHYDRNKVETLIDFSSNPDAKLFLDVVCIHASEFLRLQGYSSHYKPMVTSMWINEMRSGSEHLPHAHDGNFLAGTYYTQIPTESPPLIFHSMLHDKFNLHVPRISQATIHNQTSHELYPNPGSIVLWPGHIKHSVPKRDFAGVRRSMAFNLVITE